jgi:hypothetical protein
MDNFGDLFFCGWSERGEKRRFAHRFGKVRVLEQGFT